MDRRLRLESHMDIVLWAFFKKAKRKDALSSNVCKFVVQLWIDNIRLNPNMKDIVQRCLGRKS
jgi:hypothetical protein